jgi:hypothetical protein
MRLEVRPMTELSALRRCAIAGFDPDARRLHNLGEDMIGVAAGHHALVFGLAPGAVEWVKVELGVRAAGNALNAKPALWRWSSLRLTPLRA